MIIGFTGKKRAGKDTAAAILIQKGWKQVSFAYPLKEMLIALDPIVTADGGRLSEILRSYTLDQSKDVFPEVRRLLQRLGTECGRDIIGEYLPNPWPEIAKVKIYDYQSKGYNVAVTDVRFDDEASLIRSEGGIIIEIVGKDDPSDDWHISESGVDEALIDYTLVNESTIKNLYSAVLMLAELA